MNLDDLKRELQGHLTDGLVIVVGSGLSVAEGLPGMRELAEELKRALPPLLTGDDRRRWDRVSERINCGEALEAALLTDVPSPALRDAIVHEAGRFIREHERHVIRGAMAGTVNLRFSALLPRLLKPKTGIPVITTNYDRLLEVAVESAGMGVDTMFVGQIVGRFDERESRMSFCREVRMRKRQPVLVDRERVVLYKPHGSLDWYLRDGEPVRVSEDLDSPRLIVTPGLAKYRAGYDRPFDVHRDRANAAIDRAGRFLIIGYGFNDDHLETHLAPRIRAGVPTVLLTRTASDGAVAIARLATGMTILDHEAGGTRMRRATEQYHFPGSRIWDLRGFVDEVF